MSRPPRVPARLSRALLAVLAALCLALFFWLFLAWRQSSRPGQARLNQGREAAAHDAGRAEREWKAGEREDPTLPGNYTSLGDLYAAQGRLPEAVAQFQTAARLMPGQGELFLRLAQLQLASDDAPAAIASARRAAALLPDDPRAVGYYGILCARSLDREAAVAALRRAVRLQPENRIFRLELVRQETNRHDYAAAEADLTPLLRARPDDPQGNLFMAILYNAKPQTAETFRRTLDMLARAQAGLPPTSAVPQVRAQLYLDAGRYAEARQSFLEGLRLDPGSRVMASGLLACDGRLGRTRDAASDAARLSAITRRLDRIEALERRLRVAPGDTGARLELGRLEEADSQPDVAESCYREALRRAPQDVAARAALADFLRRAGRPGA